MSCGVPSRVAASSICMEPGVCMLCCCSVFYFAFGSLLLLFFIFFHYFFFHFFPTAYGGLHRMFNFVMNFFFFLFCFLSVWNLYCTALLPSDSYVFTSVAVALL